MKPDANWLHTVASTMRAMAEEASLKNSALAYELRALSVFTSSAALSVEDDEHFRSEEPTAPGHKPIERSCDV